MIQIAICDDEDDVLKLLVKKLENLIKKHQYSCNIECFKSGIVLLDYFNKHRYDIVLLDIEMPQINGFQVAERLKTTSSDVLIAFITNRDDLVYDSFNYDVSAFIRKKNEYSDFENSIIRLINKIQSKNQIFSFKIPRGETNIHSNEIFYFEVKNHYTYLYKNDSSSIKLSHTLSEIESMLIDKEFFRCHVGYIVNLDFVVEVNKDTFKMKDGHNIPISRNKKKEAIEAFKKNLRGKGNGYI